MACAAFADIDEQAAALNGWNQRCRQLSAGRFRGQASAEDLLPVFSGADGFEFRSPQRHVMPGIEIDVGLFAARVAGPAGLDAGVFARQARLEGIDRRAMDGLRQVLVGPLAWLRMLRLNAVRRALKTAPSVTAAATQLGFWHFGQFSHDCRSLFGELPSQTFRRHHGPRPEGC